MFEAFFLGLAGVLAGYRGLVHHTYRRVDEDGESFTVTTRDQASLRLYRLQPDRQLYAEPVLLCHGLGANRFNLNFAGEHSLARALARAGFDAWVIELRGAGRSRPPKNKPEWCFDDYVDLDLPAAVERILEETQAPQIQWVGHSMGGMLLYAFLLGPHSEWVRAGITLGSPARFLDRAGRFGLEFRLSGLLRILRQVPVKGFARWTTPLSGRVHHRFAQEVVNWGNVDCRMLRLAQYHGTENFSRGLARQFLGWIQAGEFASRDGQRQWSRELGQIVQPVMVIAGGGDGLVPLQDVRFAHESMSSGSARRSEYLEFSVASGYDSDYGHVDLVFGKQAPQVVFPQIVRWLEQHGSRL